MGGGIVSNLEGVQGRLQDYHPGRLPLHLLLAPNPVIFFAKVPPSFDVEAAQARNSCMTGVSFNPGWRENLHKGPASQVSSAAPLPQATYLQTAL
eukprot:8536553-Pyramimonas_sp.AAC.1